MTYDSKMRVLFQTYTLAFQAPGGGERVILELQRALRKRGVDVEIYDPWRHDYEAFDLLHYFSVLESSTWRFFRENYPAKPLVVTPTLFMGRQWRDRLKVERERLLSLVQPNRASDLRLPHRFLPNTVYEADSLSRYFRVPEDKLAVVPNGVGAQSRGGEETLFRRFSRIDQCFVLHVGRFHPVKRQTFLIEALRDTNVQCVFIGDADPAHPGYRERCVREAALAKNKNFHFFSGIGAEDPLLASAYAGASLFALPSEFETFGLAALEAAIAGCPLLLSNGLADPEIFRGAGRIMPARDPAVWREEILRAMNEPRKRLGREISAKLKEVYDWDAVAASVVGEYAKVLQP